MKSISQWRYSYSHNFIVTSLVFMPCKSLIKGNFLPIFSFLLWVENRLSCVQRTFLAKAISLFSAVSLRMKWASLVLLVSNVCNPKHSWFCSSRVSFVLVGLLDRHLCCPWQCKSASCFSYWTKGTGDQSINSLAHLFDFLERRVYVGVSAVVNMLRTQLHQWTLLKFVTRVILSLERR